MNKRQKKKIEQINYKQLQEELETEKIKCKELQAKIDRLVKENEELRQKRAGRKPNPERLKQKHDEVMRLKAEGKTRTEICKIMNISRATYFRYQKYNDT